MRWRTIASIASWALMSFPIAAMAQQAPSNSTNAPDQTITLPTVEVVAATPLLGSGVDRNKVPAQTQILNAGDISRAGYPDALRALNDQVPGVTLDARRRKPVSAELVLSWV